MMSSTRFFEHTDGLWLVLRLLLVGLAIALALAPSWAGGAPPADRVGSSPVVLVGPNQTGVVAGVTSAPMLPLAEPPPGAPPPDFLPGSDCALAPAGFLTA
jgi:hypothetical protein